MRRFFLVNALVCIFLASSSQFRPLKTSLSPPGPAVRLEEADIHVLDRKLSRLDRICLYGIQGFPYGFQKSIVEVMLSKWKVNYGQMALFQLTSLPWILKPLFASFSFFDRSDDRSLQRLMLLLAGLQVLLAIFVLYRQVAWLGAALLAAAFSTAAYDVLLDSRMIRGRRLSTQTDPNNLSVNSDQAMGYKLGTMLSGSAGLGLAAASDSAPAALAVSPLVCASLTILFSLRLHPSHETSVRPRPRPRREILGILGRHVRNHGWLYVLVLVYKGGESVGDALMKPFLVSEGVSLGRLAGLGLLSDLGALAGFLAPSLAPGASLQVLLVLNLLPQVLRAWVVWTRSTGAATLLVVTSLECFLGGAAAVAMSDCLFSRVLEGLEASHYSLLASLEELGKMIFRAGGLQLRHCGASFRTLFAGALLLALLPVPILSLAGSLS